jgi:hypothetical protein
VSDGTRTRGRRDHNPELYQLSYAHQDGPSIAAEGNRPPRRAARSGVLPPGVPAGWHPDRCGYLPNPAAEG